MQKQKTGKLSKKSKRLRRLIIFLVILVLLAVGVMIYFDKVVNPIIITTCESKIKMLTSSSINSSISQVISDSDIYDELVEISEDENGNVKMIQANAVRINSLSKEISKLALLKIEGIGEQGIPIPFGTFTGMPLFMGKGPDVLVKVTPIGTLDCLFKSEFVQAGINQTLHRIYLEVSSNVNLVLPVFKNRVKTFTQVIICESVIIGEVPEFYLNKGLNSLLDLVPDSVV